MTNIFIANLDWEITSDDLQATFSAFGEVHLAHVVFDNKTKKSKGFGYVEMVNAEEAIKAIQALNGFEVNGRNLDVKIASPKANRPPKKEAAPKKPFAKRPIASSGQKRYNNGPRQGGGGGGYRSDNNSGGYRSNNNSGGGYRSDNNSGNSGGYRSNNNSGGGYRSDNNSGGYRSNNNSGGGYRSDNNQGGYRSDNNSGGYKKPSDDNDQSGERKLRPRKRNED